MLASFTDIFINKLLCLCFFEGSEGQKPVHFMLLTIPYPYNCIHKVN